MLVQIMKPNPINPIKNILQKVAKLKAAVPKNFSPEMLDGLFSKFIFSLGHKRELTMY
jgi:hypothetical protein